MSITEALFYIRCVLKFFQKGQNTKLCQYRVLVNSWSVSQVHKSETEVLWKVIPWKQGRNQLIFSGG